MDDNAIILKTLSMKLQSRGYEVITAVDGAGAVSTVRRERPDLILLDINFPPDVSPAGGVAWDGFLIMDWLRRMDEAAKIPIMVITGAEPILYKERCLTAGVAGFFRKPIDHEQLFLAIHQTLGTKDTLSQVESSDLPKILFVDDEDDWRYMAAIYLKDSGYEVLAASTGSEALERATKIRPDLIILDLNLAGENGLEVMNRLKGVCPEVPILLYTGFEHDDDAVQSMLHQGAFQYLRKGTMGEMLVAVQGALKAISARR